jgi:hypothetical protein
MIARSFTVAAVVLLSAAFATPSAATASVLNAEWSPVQTASEPVPFSPEFFGKHSEENHREVLNHISANSKNLRTRNNQHQAGSGGSPFANLPNIASVNNDDAQ